MTSDSNTTVPKLRLPVTNEPSEEKPTDRTLSTAMHRLYDKWGIYKDSTSEFFTNCYYSEVTGIGKEDGVTRRDPSTVIKIGETYYVWYTKRSAPGPDYRNKPIFGKPQGWDVAVYDWDLAEIWYATSRDGFHWEEQGVAVRRGPRGCYDERSVFTPDVLVADGKYYLYYQAVDYPYVGRTRNVVGMSWAESPDGPWHRWEEPVLKPGEPGEWLGDDDSSNVKRYGAWDSHKVHDPFIIVREGKFWLYHKGQPMGWGTKYCRGIGWGVAIADRPEGPFVKSPINPVTNSGHETCLFPYKEGVLAICGHDGPEKDTIQYAPDGLNFEVVAHVVLPPCAAGPFAPDSYSNTRATDGKGIVWGLAHIGTEETKGRNSYIVRFDCNLHRDVERPGFRQGNIRFAENVHFSKDIVLADFMKKQLEAGGPQKEQNTAYPIRPTEERPSGPISAATRRIYDVYGVYKDQGSEFFSAFRYSEVTDIGKEPGVTRRDPTKVIRVGDTYCVWYTCRRTEHPPAGPANATDTVPGTDWDLAEIWCATSKDGFHWEEKGLAVPRGPEGEFDDRSVFTPDILVHEGKYYLYYQTHAGRYSKSHNEQVGMSWAESPDGPWHRWPEVVVPVGAQPELAGDGRDPDNIARFGDWDSHCIHDPYVLKRDGKIWIYYKGARHGKRYRHDLGIAWGVATADRPEGPFVKSPLNL